MNNRRRVSSSLFVYLPLALLLFLLAYESDSQPRTNSPPAGYGSPGAVQAAMLTSEVEPAPLDLEPEIVSTTSSQPHSQTASLKSGVNLGGASLISHTTEAGQTLATIASQYETSVEAIQRLNGILDPHYLPAGRLLVVPGGQQPKTFDLWPVDPTPYERKVIGRSAGGHPIEVFVFGQGERDVVIVGGIHGGYEWNSILLAYRFLSYFGDRPGSIPGDISLHIIPSGNPDGVVAVTGDVGPFASSAIAAEPAVGRLNSRGVDLNRNWGCDWSADAQWRQSSVSAGQRPFSEPETRALRDYLLRDGVEVVIWLHSAAGLVAPGSCAGISHAPSEATAALYGQAAGYPVGPFTAYPVSGDASDWLAQHDIASFTVELSDHREVELDRNLRGLLALLEGFEIPAEE